MDLIKAILSNVSADTLSKLSASLGESESNIKGALESLIPSVLAGMIAQTSNGSGSLEKLFNTISSYCNTSGGLDSLIKNPSSILNQANSASVQNLTTSIFGNKASVILKALEGLSSVSSSSISSLLTLSVPLVFGGIKKYVEDSGKSFGPSAMSSILNMAAPEIAKMLPSGLGALLSTQGLTASLSNSGAENDMLKKIGSLNPGASKGLIPISLGLLGVLAFYLFSNPSNDQALIQQAQEISRQSAEITSASLSQASKITAETLGQARAALSDAEQNIEDSSERAKVALDKVNQAIESAKDTSGNLDQNSLINEDSSLRSQVLPNGSSISFDPKSVESALLSFIEDTRKQVNPPTWFNFDKLNFESGSAKLTNESMPQIENIAAILKAYPNVTVKIGGYTDNSGNSTSNTLLSADRAKAVTTALQGKGIEASRLAYEGYGSQFAVASNDTAEGRAVNRRIAVRVTKK